MRAWSRTGKEWTHRLPELQALSLVGPVVLDGELVAATADGRADRELVTTRLNSQELDPPVTLYAFDVLERDRQPLVDRPWSEGRDVLDALNLAEITNGAARPTIGGADSEAMHTATRTIGAEGTVSAPWRPAAAAPRATRRSRCPTRRSPSR